MNRLSWQVVLASCLRHTFSKKFQNRFTIAEELKNQNDEIDLDVLQQSHFSRSNKQDGRSSVALGLEWEI